MGNLTQPCYLTNRHTFQTDRVSIFKRLNQGV